MIFPYKEACNISFEVNGQGVPIVLLHGFLENMKYWSHITTQLSSNYKVIRVDLPGHGHSETLSDGKMESMALVIKSILDYLKIEKVCIAGHSLGGYVALALAELYPERLLAFMLINSTADADTEEQRKRRDRSIKLLRSKQGFIADSIPSLFSKKGKDTYSLIIKEMQSHAKSMDAKYISEILLGMKNRPDRRKIMASLIVDKYIISGREDTLLPYKNMEIQSKDTGSKFILLEGGHMSAIEENKRTLSAIKQMFKNL